MMAEPRDFTVLPAGAFARAFPLVFGGVLLLAAMVVFALGFERPLVAIGALPALLALGTVVALFAWAVHHPRVRLAEGVLRCGRLPRLRAPVASLDLDAARVVDLGAERALQPVLRLFGTSLPGYNEGWFWLRDKSRAFLVVTDRSRVLVLPRRDGGPVLLSLERPDALLDALRRAPARG